MVRRIALLIFLLAGLANAQPIAQPSPGGPVIPSLTTGTITAPPGSAGTIGQYNINGVLNVKSPPYNASGSANTYTCTIIGGQTGLTCTAPTDFQVGQYVAIPTAGPATPLTSGATITGVTNSGISTGTFNDCYKIAAADAQEGIFGVTAATCNATGPLPMSPDWQTGVVYTTNTSFVFPRVGNTGNYVFQATTGGTSNATPVAITAATESGHTVTFTAANSLVLGQSVDIAGVTPAAYNGTYIVLNSSGGTSFTVANPIAGIGAGTVFGTFLAHPAWVSAQTVASTVTDGTVTWTNQGPVLSPTAGLSVAFTTNGNANTVYGIYRALNCSSCANSAYQFIRATSVSSYKDYGDDQGAAKGWDWPANTPAARNQTMYAKIVSGSGTSWTVDGTLSIGQAAASNTATNVTVRHDDTIAIQAAYDAGSGTEIHFPAGTYHLNMVQIVNSGGTRLGYVFNTANLGGNTVGIIQENGTKIRTTGDGTDKTFLAQDWAWLANIRGSMFNVSPAIWYGYIGPQQASGAAQLTSYPFSNATRGNFCITLFNPANASNFNVGDVVYYTGGQGINGSYTITNISKVTSASTATGNICFVDPVTSDLPQGTPTVANFIENLTTAGVAQEQFSFENLTFTTPSNVATIDGAYGFLYKNIRADENSATLQQEFLYNEWGARVTVQDSQISSNAQEWPIHSFVNIINNTWRQWPSISSWTVGYGNVFTATGNNFVFGCGAQIGFDSSNPEVIFSNNHLESSCVTGASVQDKTMFSVGTLPVPIGYSILFSNNTIISSNKSVFGASDSTKQAPPNTVIENNTLVWNHGPIAGSAFSLIGPMKALGNIIYNQQTGAVSTNSGFAVTLNAGVPGPSIVGNTVFSTPLADLIGASVSDPGSVLTIAVPIQNNHFVNLARGVNVASVTNTPTLQIFGNSMDTVTLPYNPAATVVDVIPKGVASLPFLGTTSGVNTITVPAVAGTVTQTLPIVNTTGPTANPGTSGMALTATTAGVQSYNNLAKNVGGTGTTTGATSGWSGTSATIAAAGTDYISFGENPLITLDTTLATAQNIWPFAATASHLFCYTTTACQAGGVVFTVMDGASGQALTCSCGAAATTCSDLTHSFAITAGDLLAVQVVNSNASNATGVTGCAFQING